MADRVTLTINDRRIHVPAGTVVSVAIARAGITRLRRSVTGEPRGTFCGMGICFECRVTINGQSQIRSCQTICQPGMDVRTDE